MIAFQRLDQHTYIMPGNNVIGAMTGPSGQAVIVDTGLDERYGRRILKAAEGAGFTVSAVLYTHSHVDHIGGGGYLMEHARPSFYAFPAEAAAIENSGLEGFYLYAAKPIAELATKFVHAEAVSPVQPLEAGPMAVEDVSFRAVRLPGHCLEHGGFISEDGYLFSGDALISRGVWQRTRMPYLSDVKESLGTLEVIEGMDVKACVLAHGGVAEDFRVLARDNRRAIEELACRVHEALDRPMTKEDAFGKVMEELDAHFDLVGYYLLMSTFGAYLRYLRETGRAELCLEKHRVLWNRL